MNRSEILMECLRPLFCLNVKNNGVPVGLAWYNEGKLTKE